MQQMHLIGFWMSTPKNPPISYILDVNDTYYNLNWDI